MRRVLFSLLGACLITTGCVTSTPKSLYQADAQARLTELAAGNPEVEFFRSLQPLPAALREQLRDVSDAGGPFSPGCVGPYPHERFLAATKTGSIYTVALEQGGIVYAWFITQFVFDENGRLIHTARIERGEAANPIPPLRSNANAPSSAASSDRWLRW